MLDMLPFGRDQVIRVALVMALLAGVTAAAFGIGYRSSDAVLGDGSAYVQKGHTIAHVNAESGRSDAEAARDLATGRQRLEVVQVRPGEVYVVNNATGEVWRLPTDTMQAGRVDGVPAAETGADGPPQSPGPQGESPAPKSRSQLVSGGGAAFLHDPDSGKLSRLDGQRAMPVTTPARIDAVVVDGSGTAWALSKADGVLYEVSGTGVRGSQTVAKPGEAARLTLVANHPVVLLPERGGGGVIRVIGAGDGPAELIVGEQPDGALQIARPSGGPPVLAVLSQRDDLLVTVDLKTGEERRLHIEGRNGPRSYGNPVIARDHIYIPDFNSRQVLVVQIKPLRQVRSVPVPGREPSFDVFERDGRVWVNDPYARTLLTFNGDRWSEPDKGDGRGVNDDDRETPPTTKPPTPPSPPRASRSPRPSPSPAPPRRVTVPPVAGLSGAEACNRVNAAELTCQPPVTKQQPGCVTGQALESSPAAGSQVAPRSQVTVFVCGPTAVPGPLVGMPIDQACRTLEAAGLVCARRDGGPAPSPAQVGTVSGQNPPPGTQVPNGSGVEVAYFTSVTVPQITGMGPAQACATLQAQGLGCAPNPEEITWEANVVHAQSHPPGTAVAVGTAIGYAYQDTGPSPLNRWKKIGEHVRYLSVGGSPGGGWDPQPAIGGAYPPAGGVPGLAPVYQFRCTNNCGSASNRMTTSYFYNMDPNALNGQSKWTREGVAFSCFSSPQPGTRALKGMYNPSLVAWAFAPEGAWEYNTHLSEGYTANIFTICWIWYGVPGFP